MHISFKIQKEEMCIGVLLPTKKWEFEFCSKTSNEGVPQHCQFFNTIHEKNMHILWDFKTWLIDSITKEDEGDLPQHQVTKANEGGG